ncbi:MAG: Holliday junction branch migration protein RuvA [Chlamydiae bacterium]|nr:Holliday junction branch migration protein RuvA [Chlamydiota bacterium]
MFEYIRGILTEVKSNRAVVEAHGVGYAVHVSSRSLSNFPPVGKEIILYVRLIVREDSHTLFGFTSYLECQLFDLMNEVSGIGPKTALTILGNMDPNEFKGAIVHGQAQELSKIPGIGKKLAERLVVELKDKFKKIFPQSLPISSVKVEKEIVSDAINALINLGFQSKDAEAAVKKVLQKAEEPLDLPQLIRLSLKGKTKG